MTIEETKHDLLLKRIQIACAILASIVAILVGAYNLKKSFFEKPAPAVAAPRPTTAQSDKIRSALEEVGASWIETLKKDNK